MSFVLPIDEIKGIVKDKRVPALNEVLRMDNGNCYRRSNRPHVHQVVVG